MNKMLLSNQAIENINLPSPPSDSSHTTRMELEELETIIQEAKLPRALMRVADRDPLRLFFSLAKKKGIDPHEAEAKELAEQLTNLSFDLKNRYKRRRPWEVKREHDVDFVVDKTDTSDSSSYPSGHALMGYGVAEFYKDKYPLMAGEWDNLADIIAHQRMQSGVHYPSDIKASKKVVEQIYSNRDKTAEEQPLLRHRSTLLIRDPETNKLLAAKEPPNSKASPFFFPGGGLYEDEYSTPRNPTEEEIIEGARREALEELGMELNNPRVVGSFGQELEGWWKEKTLKNRGVPYLGGHEHYVLADKGKEDRSLYNIEGDAFEQGDYYDPKEIVEALSRAAKSDSAFAPFNREQVRAIKENLLSKKAALESQESIFERLKDLVPKGTYHVSGGLPDARGISDVDMFYPTEDHTNLLDSLPKGTTITKSKPDKTIYTIPGYDREVNLFATLDPMKQESILHRATMVALAKQYPELERLAFKEKATGLGSEPAWTKILGVDGDPYERMQHTEEMLEAAKRVMASRSKQASDLSVLTAVPTQKVEKTAASTRGGFLTSGDMTPPTEADPNYAHLVPAKPKRKRKDLEEAVLRVKEEIAKASPEDMEYSRLVASGLPMEEIIARELIDPYTSRDNWKLTPEEYKQFRYSVIKDKKKLYPVARPFALAERYGIDLGLPDEIAQEEARSIDAFRNFSYPSFHTARGAFLAETARDLVPEDKQNLVDELISRIGRTRIQQGVHSHQDVEAGELLGREAAKIYKEKGIKTASEQDQYVYHAVPRGNRDSIAQRGILSGAAILEDPEMLKALAKKRNWTEEQTAAKIRKNLEDEYWHKKETSPSVFFTEPDWSQVPEWHTLRQDPYDLYKVNLSKYMREVPGAKIHGVELKPWVEGTPYEERDITLEEAAELASRGPKGLWKDYNPIEGYYAVDVPHAFLGSDANKIPAEYAELMGELTPGPLPEKQVAATTLKEAIQKTSSAKEQLKHILITGQSGSGKTTEAKRLAKELSMPVIHLDEQKGFGAKGVDPDYIEDLTEATQDIISKLDKPHIVEGTQMLSEQFPTELLRKHDLRIMEADEDELVRRLTERGWNTESGRDLKGPDSADEARHVSKHQRKQVDRLLKSINEKTSSAKEKLKHILVTGHSGAGKTTYARQLAEELGIPLHRLDVTTGPIMEAEYPEYWDKGTLGYPEDVSTRVIQQALDLDTPHVIEGSHILEVPELTEGYKRVLIDTPEDRVVEQRAQREYRNQGRKGKPYRPIEKHREAAKELVNHYRDIVTNFRSQPGVESIITKSK